VNAEVSSYNRFRCTPIDRKCTSRDSCSHKGTITPEHDNQPRRDRQTDRQTGAQTTDRRFTLNAIDVASVIRRSPPKVIWERPRRHPRGGEWTRPLRALGAQCPLQRVQSVSRRYATSKLRRRIVVIYGRGRHMPPSCPFPWLILTPS